MTIVASSDPSSEDVTPHGGRAPAYGTNPLAVGIPTSGDPILIDLCTASTTVGMTQHLRGLGLPLPDKWLVDHRGHASDDSNVLISDPPGAILPLGGTFLGYKGFALAIVVDALTVALSGYGRSARSVRGGASVFVQVIDPRALGGLGEFCREIELLRARCKSVPARVSGPEIWMPGEQALAKRQQAMVTGISLAPGVMDLLAAWARKLHVAEPIPL